MCLESVGFRCLFVKGFVHQNDCQTKDLNLGQPMQKLEKGG